MRGIPKRGRGQARRQTSEQALLQAFEGLLARHGPEGLGVNAVLDSAGVGKRLLYEYFGDLEGLAAAWSRERSDPLALNERDAELRSRLQGRGPAAAVVATVTDYADQIRQHPWVAQVLLAELSRPDTLGRAMRDIRREMGRDYERVLLDCGAFARLEHTQLALILHAAATYLALRARFAPDYNGIDLSTPEGWQATRDAFATLEKLLGVADRGNPAKAAPRGTPRRPAMAEPGTRPRRPAVAGKTSARLASSRRARAVRRAPPRVR